MVSSFLVVSLISAAPGAAPDAGVGVTDPVALRARSVLGPFKKQLKETLVSTMKQSPEAAIDVCAKVAPELAQAASKDGVVVGRTSARLRNPANAPAAWVVPLLAELAKEKPGSDAWRVVELPGGKKGYAEALWTQEPCLACHGEAIAPGVDAKLKAAYPKDAARGFKLDELRGVAWAEIEAGGAAPAGGKSATSR